MSESKHTPGPWVVSDHADATGTCRVEAPDAGDIIAEGIDPSNAPIVAAAPEMLEALRGLIFPEAPSADDLMLLFLASGVTVQQQEKFRPFVEKYRAAQAVGRAASRKATGGEP